MLLSYSMHGFKSVRNNIKVDLKSTNYKILSKSNVSNTGILKGALFIGQNGSGKSTMIQSVKLLLDLMFNENEIDLRNYFCLTNTEEKHIKLTYDFYIRSSNINYEIDIEYGKPLLITEKLYVNQELFVDRLGSNGRYSNDSNPVHATNIESNRLFLRDLYESNFLNGNKILFEFMNFLHESCYVNPLENKVVPYNEAVNSHTMQVIESQVNDMNEVFDTLNLKFRLIIRNDKDKVSLRLKRDEEQVALPISMESTGIKHLIRMLPSYLNVMKKGGLLIIDEFGVLHPTLEKKLIGYFEENTKNGQVLLATNSTTILNSNVLRADQLYSVYKDGNSTNILRFSSKQPRELQNMEKMYFNGTFNGIDE